MLLQTVLASGTTITPAFQFTILVCLTIITFVLAVTRQTIITFMLNSLMWLSLAVATYIVGDAESGLTQGLVGTFFLLFVIMLVFAVKETFQRLADIAEQKQRQMETEVF